MATILLVVGQLYVAKSRMQKAADIAAESYVALMGDGDPVVRAKSVAINNGADSLRLKTRPNGALIVEVTKHVSGFSQLLSSNDVVARAPVPYRNFGVVASAQGSAGDYSGPLVKVDAAVSCPRVALAYRLMQRGASLSGVRLFAISGFRTRAEQAILYAKLGPGIAAPPGRSLHEQATEFDLAVGPAGSPIHRWLADNAQQFGFIQRYPTEPWHWGYTHEC